MNKMNKMNVLVTGSFGMIGCHLVKKLIESEYNVIGVDMKPADNFESYEHHQINLGDVDALEAIFNDKHIDRVIHLAALAHTTGGKKYPKRMYEYLNVECADNVFEVSAKHDVPVLFISTVDVYGFQKDAVTPDSVCKPVTIYGKTKLKAEQLLKKSGCKYSIFRLSPVWTRDIKRDIQKRYYLKYPNWAYQIGDNSFYEVLNIDKAIKEMTNWCSKTCNNDITILKDEQLLETKSCIRKEKECGRAKHVIKVPRWLACFGYGIVRISGKNKYTFLLNKALYPLRSNCDGI